ncbi:perlucin-like protein [Mercenaria mercenaria]|uniref:perlucin-like protein n=1 Tax=Mercenaria mercenaria TaxID=6596 RepID=UPI00234F748D|nr:perlucin-like protein [Mercenaria mercenaria]
MTMLTSGILLFLFLCSHGALGCPNGWMTHENSCYHFSHDTEDWIDAVAACKILGGHLVEIDDATENQYLVNQAKLINSKESFWIGLNDLQEEGSWVWVDSNEAVSYTNWYPGQPDNEASNENCAHLNPVYNDLWNDKECYSLLNYICEKTSENAEIIG